MRRNLAASLIQHETISTTIQKAKEVKPFVERLITLAKKGTLQSRRRVIGLLGNRDLFEYEDGTPVRKGTVVGKLFSELGPRYLERPGGYTRIIRLSLTRLGDNGQLVLLQLLGPDEPLKKETKASTKKRARRKAAKAAKAEQRPKAAQVVEEESSAEEDQAKEAKSADKVDQAEGAAEQNSAVDEADNDGRRESRRSDKSPDKE